MMVRSAPASNKSPRNARQMSYKFTCALSARVTRRARIQAIPDFPRGSPRPLLRHPRHAEQSGSLRRGPFPAPVVPLRRAHLGVAGEPLHDRQVGPGVEQVPDKRSPDVVRAHVRDLGAHGEASEDLCDRRLSKGRRSSAIRPSSSRRRAVRGLRRGPRSTPRARGAPGRRRPGAPFSLCPARGASMCRGRGP